MREALGIFVFFVAIFAPFGLLLLIGIRKKWKFRRYIPYGVPYWSLVTVLLLWGGGRGLTGWPLLFSWLAITTVVYLVMRAWDQIMEVGERARRERGR